MTEKQYFKTLLDGKKSGYGNHQWRVNEWYKCEGELELCSNGFHASELIQDAIGYIKPGFVCKVEVRGDAVHDSDKSCFREMRIVKAYKWTKEDSVALAIFCAEQVLSLYEKEYPKDMRVRDAIKAAKKWLKNPTKENAYAAYAAADAAGAAAYAAADAAGAAAYAAYAAGAAAYAAYDAAYARADMKLKIHNWILKRVGF